MPGILTATQLAAEVQQTLGNRVDLNLTTARIQNSLNIAQQRISRFYYFSEMRITTQSTQAWTGNNVVDKFLPIPTVDLNSNPIVPRIVVSVAMQDQGNSSKLIKKSVRHFDRKVPYDEYIASTWPRYYALWDQGQVMLYPVPMAPYLYFWRLAVDPAPLNLTTPTGQAAVSPFTNKDDIIIFIASAYLLRTLGRPDLAQGLEQEALLRLQEAKGNDDSDPDMDISPDDMGSGPNTGEYWANPFIRAVYET